MDGADPMSDVSHKVRMADISFGISTSPRANLHFGYLLNRQGGDMLRKMILYNIVHSAVCQDAK